MNNIKRKHHLKKENENKVKESIKKRRKKKLHIMDANNTSYDLNEWLQMYYETRNIL